SILVKGKVVAEGSMKKLLSNEQEFIEVHTTSPGISEILKQIDFVKSFKDLQGKFLVEIKKGYAGELNRRLLTAGISVNYLIPRNSSLEEYFMALTKGGILSDQPD
ncbi:MAG TPA: hypothetical protein GX697_06630, partial [Firmicutes bacterium]|nr:hypothetical protein [Bacillota bacterium]